MANWIKSTNFDFLRWSKLSFALAASIILIGGFFVYNQKATLFGMDFTGGFALNLELETHQESHYTEALEKAFRSKGLSSQQFQIRELNPSNHLRVLLSTALEEPGQPFSGMPLEMEKKGASYGFETNPRIQWVVDAIEGSGLSLSAESKSTLHTNWTAMSGQVAVRLSEDLAFDVPWQAGDVALLDNYVVMHGRRPFTGTRKILAAMS